MYRKNLAVKKTTKSNMDQIYKKAVSEALEAVKDVEDADLKKSAFEIVLRQLLNAAPDHTRGGPGTDMIPPESVVAKPNSNHTNKTGLTKEEIDTLFETKGEIVVLKVKPTGESLLEQQQALAHAILIGYHALFGKDSVTSVMMGTAARDWNLLDTNFSRTIQIPGYIQAKGKRKGVTYSLKPGAIAKLKESMQKMARGE